MNASCKCNDLNRAVDLIINIFGQIMKSKRFYILLAAVGLTLGVIIHMLTPRTYEYRLYYKTQIDDFPLVENTLGRDFFQFQGEDVYVDPNFVSHKDYHQFLYRVFELQLYTNIKGNQVAAAKHYLKKQELITDMEPRMFMVELVRDFKLMHISSAAFMLVFFLGVLFKTYIIKRKSQNRDR